MKFNPSKTTIKYTILAMAISVVSDWVTGDSIGLFKMLVTGTASLFFFWNVEVKGKAGK